MNKYIYITSLPRKSHKGSEGLSNFINRLKKNTQVPTRVTHRTKETAEIALRHSELHQEIMRMLRYIYLDEIFDGHPDKEKYHTHTFQIPKKGGGSRTIVAPGNYLKISQQHILHRLQKRIKVLEHDAAYAYVEGRSIKSALMVHQANDSKFFLKVDIEKFFDNCTTELLQSKLSVVYPFNKYPKDVLTKLINLATLNGVLPQGMPLSPFLTNILMVPFDYTFSWYCKQKGLIYTRYADDILISSKEDFSFETVINKIHSIFEKLDYPFKLKESKTRYGTRNGRNWNLGLMLNKDNQITVGHVKKKELKTIIYKIVNNEIIPDDHIQGTFAYLKQIEPVYFNHLDQYCTRVYNKSLVDILKP